MKKFYLTTAIPYVNAPPHLGHALEFVQTDVLARYHRLKGEEVYLTTGADENALKNVRAAEEKGVSIQELVDKNAELFKEFAKKLNVQVNSFERGSDKKSHWPGVQELWARCQKSGDIYKKKYKGLYCVGHEAFLTEKELTAGLCPDHQTRPELIEEENYFFRLSKYEKKLERLIEENKEYKIIPESRRNEVLSFLRLGLEDFSISRSNERAKNWGVPVPGDASQRIYVWFDALGIYLTAVGFGIDNKKFAKWWPADLHVIGKDIIRFHAVYWPAILLSAGLPLPRALLVHGFVTSGGQKMSKTVGNVIDPVEYINEFGADALRYFLLSEIPTTEDGDFTREKFIGRYNGDLANGLGNLAARILTLAEGKELTNHPGAIATVLKETWDRYRSAFEDFDIRKTVEIIWDLIHILDGFIEEKKPWKAEDETVLATLATGLANVASLLQPLLPETAERIFAGLGVSPDDQVWHFKPRKIKPLFPRF